MSNMSKIIKNHNDLKPVVFLTAPGDVISRDRDVHFIGHKRLMDLYGVDPSQCRAFCPHTSRFATNVHFYILEPSYNYDRPQEPATRQDFGRVSARMRRDEAYRVHNR